MYIYVSRFLHLVPKKKWIMTSVKFSVKIYRYVPHGYRVALYSGSFWDAENSKG